MPTKELAQYMKNAKRIVAFTGAGISTGSGIPDFRGPQGLWKQWRPIYYNEFMSSEEARILHWKFKLAGWKQFLQAKPNPAHLALSSLDTTNRLEVVITQNIDGLHQMAGLSKEKVIELHGTNRAVECQSCKKLSDPEPVFQQFESSGQSPTCPCGGFLKPATISFGQQMPTDKLAQAFETAAQSDLVITIGSTLEVEPAASIPLRAKEKGARYIIINRGPTAQDHLADLRLEGDATILLPEAVQHLFQLLKNDLKAS